MAAGAVGTPILAQLLATEKAFAKELESLQDAPLSEIRSRYMLDEGVTYLNNASIGTIPEPVFQARAEYLKTCERNPWLYMWGGEWDKPREAVRGKVARFLNCSADEIAFTHNTTEVFNVLAHGLPLGEGDEVLYSNLNHVGASQAFELVAEQRGFTIKKFELPLADVGGMNREQVIQQHIDQITPRTRLLVLPHMDNTVGLRHPVKEIAERARSKGVEYIAVDGAQTVGMIPVDMEDLGVDVYATSAHKWIQAPKGVSFAYFDNEVQKDLKPMWVTWGQDREAWRTTARKYEDYGTRNLAEVLTVAHAIEFFNTVDWKKRTDHLRSLWDRTRQLVDRYPKARWHSPRSWELSGSLYAIEIAGMSSSELFEDLYNNHGLVFRAFELPGMSIMRVSPNLLTTGEDLDRFFTLATKA